MEEIREKIQYKDGSIEICMNGRTSIEQYEIIRLLIAFPEKKVSLCTHESTNRFIDDILKQINISFFQCFTETTLFK